MRKGKKITYSLKHYWALYRKRAIGFPKKYLSDKSKSHSTRTLTRIEHRQIISKYMNVYFNEFYFQDKPKYFPLGGLLEKIQGKKTIFKNRIVNPILLLWHNRPDILFFTNIKLAKQNGRTNRIYKLDKAYKENNDLDMLPGKSYIDELVINNEMFKNL